MSFERAIAAYSDVEETSDPLGNRIDPLPRFWTGPHVAKHLLDGFRVIDATTTVPGPKAFGNAWPEIERDVADLNDVQAWENHKQAFEAGARIRTRPSPIEIQMAEEAILWPGTALPADSQELDALHLWTVATARNLNVQRILNRRKAQADAMIAAIRRSMGLSPAVISDPDQFRATMRGVMASANILVDEANTALLMARERAHAARQSKDKAKADRRLRSAERAAQHALEDAAYARKLAVIRLRRIVNIEGLLTRPPGERIRRSEVMPGKVFNQSAYDERRSLAADAIADALHRRGVAVR